MGLGGEEGNKVYISIVEDRFTVRVPEGTEGAISRKLKMGPKAGTEIWEKRYKWVAGHIRKIEVTKKDFGNFLEITISEDYEKVLFVVQISWDDFSSRDAFIKSLPNIDSNRSVKLQVWRSKDDQRRAFCVMQNDEPVKWAFTKENPNGLPAPEEKTVMGEKKYDFSKVDDFLYQLLLEEAKRFSADNEAIGEEPDFENMLDDHGITDEPEIDMDGV